MPVFERRHHREATHCHRPVPDVHSRRESGGVKTETITYKVGDKTYKGYLAYDDAKEKRPGILVVHEFWGLNDYARKRADKLAELG